jgi:LysM repeat protein
VVQEGDTLGTIAQTHGLESQELAALNGLAADAELAPVQQLQLPDDAEYIVQQGDTWESVAARHGLAPNALAEANELDPADELSPTVVLELPKVDAYVAQGQSLEDVAGGFGNVTPERLAEVNELDAELVYPIGTTLVVPEEAYGSAPPDAINPGTACIQHAVPQSVFAEIGGTAFEPTRPEAESNEVVIEANSNDWIVVADGEASEPNEGVALIAAGTQVRFVNNAGLHTISPNGEKEGDNFEEGEERTITFDEPGEFEILCDFHPDMFAYLYVE